MNVRADITNTINKASPKERIEVYEHLKSTDVLKAVDNGLYEYQAHWTDATVAEFIGKKLGGPTSPNAVQTVRKEMFGNLKALPPMAPEIARLMELEKQVSMQRDLIRALENRIAELNATLVGKGQAILVVQTKLNDLRAEFDKLKLGTKFRVA